MSQGLSIVLFFPLRSTGNLGGWSLIHSLIISDWDELMRFVTRDQNFRSMLFNESTWGWPDECYRSWRLHSVTLSPFCNKFSCLSLKSKWNALVACNWRSGTQTSSIVWIWSKKLNRLNAFHLPYRLGWRMLHLFRSYLFFPWASLALNRSQSSHNLRLFQSWHLTNLLWQVLLSTLLNPTSFMSFLASRS